MIEWDRAAREEIERRLRITNAQFDPALENITVTNKLIITENDHAYLTRIDKNREYELCDREGQVLKKKETNYSLSVMSQLASRSIGA